MSNRSRCLSTNRGAALICSASTPHFVPLSRTGPDISFKACLCLNSRPGLFACQLKPKKKKKNKKEASFKSGGYIHFMPLDFVHSQYPCRSKAFDLSAVKGRWREWIEPFAQAESDLDQGRRASNRGNSIIRAVRAKLFIKLVCI